MKTILVVDDDAAIGELVTDRLALAGYRSLRACAAARRPCDADRPDMVLCDMPVPPEAGADAARAAREAGGVQAAPVVIMSSYYGYVAAAERSQVAFKEFSLRTLLEVVAASIGTP